MENTIIYVHGKGGAADEAGHYRRLFPEMEVVGFDYSAQTPWEAKKEFPRFFAGQRRHGEEHWFHTEEQMRFLDAWILAD